MIGSHTGARTVTLAVVLLLIVGLATFAGGQTESTATAEPEGKLDTWVSDETLTFSMMLPERATIPYQEDWLLKTEIERRANVQLDIMTAPDNDYQTKLNLVLSSGSPPDIITKALPGWIAPFAESGIVLPASDYFERMPYLQGFRGPRNFDAEVDRFRLEDGKLYIFPGVHELAFQTQGWTIRVDIFEKHGLAIPETFDEMFDSLKKLKEIYPNSTPITARYNGGHLLSIIGAGFGIPAGWRGPAHYDESRDRWYFAPCTENYRAMLRWLNKAMSAGILDKEAFTQDEAMYNQKRYSNRAFVDVDWFGGGMANVNAMMRDAGYEGANWQPFLPPETPLGMRKNLTASRFSGAVALPSRVTKEAYFDKLLAFVDWCHYSAEAIDLGSWGLEGVTYEVTEGGRRFLPHIQTWYNVGNDLVTLKKEYGLTDGTFVINFPTDYRLNVMPEEVADLVRKQVEMDMIAERDPALTYTDEEEDMLKVIGTPLKDYADTMTLKFIYGDADLDTEWDSYVSECKTKGLEKIEGIYNQAWERKKARSG